MHLLPFHSFFPELAVRETRTIVLLEDAPELPAGEYGFIEHYCAESKRKCDCRRVLLIVHTPNSPKPLAAISFGFDRDEPMAGPFLDPFHRRAEYAQGILEIAEDMLFSDPKYVARLERHYEQVKAAVAGKPRDEFSMDKPDVATMIAEKRALRKQRRTWEKRRK